MIIDLRVRSCPDPQASFPYGGGALPFLTPPHIYATNRRMSRGLYAP